MKLSWSTGLAAALVVGVLSQPAGGLRNRLQEPRVLFLMTQQYGANCHLALDIMTRRGWDVTIVGVSEVVVPCSAYGGPLGCRPIRVDALVTEITDVAAYDCLAIPPAKAWSGNSHYELLNNPDALALVQDAAAEGLVLAAWCGGTRVLAAADVIEGVRVTGHPLYQQEYEEAGAIYVPGNIPPVESGQFVTIVAGQSYAPEAMEAIAAAIESARERRGHAAPAAED